MAPGSPVNRGAVQALLWLLPDVIEPCQMLKASAYQCRLYLHSGLKLDGMLSWQPGRYKALIYLAMLILAKPKMVLLLFSADRHSTTITSFSFLFLFSTF